MATNDFSEMRSDLDPRRLWAGGLATAAVAALGAVAGVLIARGLCGVAVLAPERDGLWGNTSTGLYALFAAAAALAATGLRHVLSAVTPLAGEFFGWMMTMCTLIAVVLPLTLGADLGSRVATAAINLALGAIITVLVNVTAASAYRVRENTQPSRRIRREPVDLDDDLDES
jgi:hypothetical protein